MTKKLSNKTMPKMMKLMIASLLSMTLAACQKASFQTVMEESSLGKDQVDSTKPRCELDPVDFNLKTSVYAFELTDNTEVSLGFNLISGMFRALGLQIKLKRGALDLSMKATDPLNGSIPLALEQGKSTYKAKYWGTKVDLTLVSLGFSHFSQTPLAELTRDGLENGFNNVAAKLAGLQWQSKVTKVLDDDHLVLSVGALAGIREGDRFNIYNVENIWQGAPCTSELIISQKLSESPLAVVEVIQVGATAAVLQLISRNSSERIEPGALVEIQELKKANPKEQRALAKSVRIVGMESGPLVINNVKVDIVDYMRHQLGPIISAKGFLLHE